MINCKFEGEIVVCSVDDIKSESEDNRLFVRVGGGERRNLRAQGGNRWRRQGEDAIVVAEGSTDHEFGWTQWLGPASRRVSHGGKYSCSNAGRFPGLLEYTERLYVYSGSAWTDFISEYRGHGGVMGERAEAGMP